MSDPWTTWRLVALHGLGHLDVALTVDTTAPVVVAAIEAAAQAHGITLQRVVDDDVGE